MYFMHLQRMKQTLAFYVIQKQIGGIPLNDDRRISILEKLFLYRL